MKYTSIAVLITIAYLFFSTFSNVFYNIFIEKTKDLKLNINKTGTIWFIGLIIINIVILTFIIGFYYYKTNYAIGILGPRGYPGQQGIDGIDEEGCIYQSI